MRLGRIEILLLILVVCGSVYMAIQFFPSGGPKMCAPVPLSPEVKAYIDQKLAANAGNAQCGDIPAVVSRISDLEVKLGGFAKFEEMRQGLQEKRDTLNVAIQDTRATQTEVLARLRNTELARLRGEMAMMCAGVTVRSSGGGAGGAQTPGAGGANRRGNRGGGAGGGANRGGSQGGAGGAATNPGGAAAGGANGGAGAGQN